MMYEFRFEDGSTVLKRFPMGECPKSISEDGKTAVRVFSIPCISIRRDNPANGDRARIAEELDYEKQSLGIRELTPLKGQSVERQLADVKANRTKFSEEMARCNENVRRSAASKRRAKPRQSIRELAAANRKRNENKARMDYNSRRISL